MPESTARVRGQRDADLAVLRDTPVGRRDDVLAFARVIRAQLVP
jgi:hypothetical protein